MGKQRAGKRAGGSGPNESGRSGRSYRLALVDDVYWNMDVAVDGAEESSAVDVAECVGEERETSEKKRAGPANILRTPPSSHYNSVRYLLSVPLGLPSICFRRHLYPPYVHTHDHLRTPLHDLHFLTYFISLGVTDAWPFAPSASELKTNIVPPPSHLFRLFILLTAGCERCRDSTSDTRHCRHASSRARRPPRPTLDPAIMIS